MRPPCKISGANALGETYLIRGVSDHHRYLTYKQSTRTMWNYPRWVCALYSGKVIFGLDGEKKWEIRICKYSNEWFFSIGFRDVEIAVLQAAVREEQFTRENCSLLRGVWSPLVSCGLTATGSKGCCSWGGLARKSDTGALCVSAYICLHMHAHTWNRVSHPGVPLETGTLAFCLVILSSCLRACSLVLSHLDWSLGAVCCETI